MIQFQIPSSRRAPVPPPSLPTAVRRRAAHPRPRNSRLWRVDVVVVAVVFRGESEDGRGLAREEVGVPVGRTDHGVEGPVGEGLHVVVDAVRAGWAAGGITSTSSYSKLERCCSHFNKSHAHPLLSVPIG